jgi:hypothetical protein
MIYGYHIIAKFTGFSSKSPLGIPFVPQGKLTGFSSKSPIGIPFVPQGKLTGFSSKSPQIQE